MYVLYFFSLCCSVYYLCVNVYLQIPPGTNPIAVNKMYQYININIVKFTPPFGSNVKSFQQADKAYLEYGRWPANI